MTLKHSIHLGCITLCLLLFSFFSIGFCEGRTNQTVYVGGNGPGNYTSIQTAVDVSENGTCIYIFQGVYYENLLLNKQVTLRGEERNVTVLDGNQTEYVITIFADNCTVSNLTVIHGGGKFPDAGICVKSNNNHIIGNHLTDNFYGIFFSQKTTSNEVSNNLIDHNHQCGIYFSASSYNLLSENTITDQPFNGFGLYEQSNFNTIIKNTFSNNMFCGVNIRDSLSNIIENNTFYNNSIGLHIPPPDHSTRVQNNIFTENKIQLQEEFDVSLFSLLTFFVVVIIVFMFFLKVK